MRRDQVFSPERVAAIVFFRMFSLGCDSRGCAEQSERVLPGQYLNTSTGAAFQAFVCRKPHGCWSFYFLWASFMQ